MKLLPINQGTDEWHEWRKSGVGASETPALMGTSPWMTQYKLWKLKNGLIEPDLPNDAMLRGITYEDEARAKFVEQFGIFVEPACAVGQVPWLIASFDGINEEERTIVEIKVPSQENYKKAWESDDIPPQYYDQIQHQLLVAGYERAYYFVYNPETEGWLCKEIQADEYRQKEILNAVDTFWNYVLTMDEFPDHLKSGNENVESREHDFEFVTAVREWKHCKAALQPYAKAEKLAKDKVLSLMGKKGAYAENVQVFSCERRGSLDESLLKEWVELNGGNLNDFRRPASKYWRMQAYKE